MLHKNNCGWELEITPDLHTCFTARRNGWKKVGTLTSNTEPASINRRHHHPG